MSGKPFCTGGYVFYGCACDGLAPSLMPMRNGRWGSLRTREGSTGMKNSVPKTISFNPRTYKGVAVCPAAFGNRYRKRPGGCVRQRGKTLIVRVGTTRIVFTVAFPADCDFAGRGSAGFFPFVHDSDGGHCQT